MENLRIKTNPPFRCTPQMVIGVNAVKKHVMIMQLQEKSTCV